LQIEADSGNRCASDLLFAEAAYRGVVLAGRGRMTFW